jgi:DNA polymerase-3 subunit gamma/tau
MTYQVLARKWRPKSFDTLIGQEHVVRALTNALEQQRLHHAYLLTGTRGVGKTTIARILAKSLNCETGITAHPCGTCPACVEIDKGRFIDLIEVDAASNTQVDNMRDLLENAQYAPTSGRFKVYIIDEVHMLSKSSFNAMLKTLEEPPAHVKFILATTDSQKMPVTVLSRCLQFNLRQMASASIVEHAQAILKTENIPFDLPALQLIAKAAAGSMRDALSLLDQAIAYGSQTVQEKEVRAMLGAIDQSYLFDLLNALIANDGESLMAQAQRMAERSISFEGALNDLATLLQQIAMAQVVPNSLALDAPERPALLDLASKISPEKVQLYYQITLLGRRDLGLAPDDFAGFTMTLLRMLAFSQSDQITASSPNTAPSSAPINKPEMAKPEIAKPEVSKPAASASAALREAIAPAVAPSVAPMPTPEPAPAELVQEAPVEEFRPVPESFVADAAPEVPAAMPSVGAVAVESTIDTQAAPQATLQFNGNWRQLVDNLKLGLARTLATHCELEGFDESSINLTVPEAQKHLLEATYQDKLSSAINDYFGRKVKLNLRVGGTGNTPAQQMFEEKAVIQSEAVAAIQQDDFVQALINDFGAQIIPSSIKPISQN